MAGLTGWWSRRSHPEKVELYTRWTYHGLCGTEALLTVPSALAVALGAAGGEAGAVGGWLLLLALAHPVLVGVLCARALSWQLGRRPRPGRLAGAVAVTSAAGCVGVAAVQRWGGPLDTQLTAPVMVGFAAWAVGGLALCVLKARQMLALGLAAPTGVALLCVALRVPSPEAVAFTVGSGFGCLVFAATSGFSGWLLRAVWELDAAHRLQARLAVAEERLRFGRDLHDVMGRNLSVIALKSELAAQLARRGSVERAEEQMAEVQRIARESQREVREVVRGYREADLHTELEGARGVLTAAGIRCRITTGAADLDLPAPVRAALGWVVREATTNVLHHGDAHTCTLTLTGAEGKDEVILTIENDGASRPADGASGVTAPTIGAAAGEAAPGEAAPGEAAPGEAAPGEAAPGEADAGGETATLTHAPGTATADKAATSTFPTAPAAAHLGAGTCTSTPGGTTTTDPGTTVIGAPTAGTPTAADVDASATDPGAAATGAPGTSTPTPTVAGLTAARTAAATPTDAPNGSAPGAATARTACPDPAHARTALTAAAVPGTATADGAARGTGAATAGIAGAGATGTPAVGAEAADLTSTPSPHRAATAAVVPAAGSDALDASAAPASPRTADAAAASGTTSDTAETADATAAPVTAIADTTATHRVVSGAEPTPHTAAPGTTLTTPARPSGAAPTDSASPAGAPTPGSGLAGLRERVVGVGGTLEAGPLPGGRFRVTARVPLARSPQAPMKPPRPRTGAAAGEVTP